MHACRYGHWEVLQTLLLFRSNVCMPLQDDCMCLSFLMSKAFIQLGCVSKVTRSDYLSGRTALHFAAVDGHVRCIRLLLSDFIPSAPFEENSSSCDGGNKQESKGNSPASSLGRKFDQSYALFLFCLAILRLLCELGMLILDCCRFLAVHVRDSLTNLRMEALQLSTWRL